MYTLYILINIVYHSSYVNKYEANKNNHNNTSAYDPEVNGLVERRHRVLKDTVKATANKHQDWLDLLPVLLLGLRHR